LTLGLSASGRQVAQRHLAVGLEQPGPVVRAGAGFDADGAWRQAGHQRVQLGARHARLQWADYFADPSLKLSRYRQALQARSEVLRTLSQAGLAALAAAGSSSSIV
jgi:hypothetical protein